MKKWPYPTRLVGLIANFKLHFLYTPHFRAAPSPSVINVKSPRPIFAVHNSYEADPLTQRDGSIDQSVISHISIACQIEYY